MLGAAEFGDVGERGDETAARHRVAAYLDDAAIGEHALGEVRGTGAHECQPPVHCAFVVATLRHRLQRPAGQVNDRPAHLQQLVGKAE